MHYQSIRNIMHLISIERITEVTSRDCEAGFYFVDTDIGYTLKVSPFLCCVRVYRHGKFIGGVMAKCHHSYIKAFCEKAIVALENGAKCTNWDRTCFIEDVNDEPCKYV